MQDKVRPWNVLKEKRATFLKQLRQVVFEGRPHVLDIVEVVFLELSSLILYSIREGFGKPLGNA